MILIVKKLGEKYFVFKFYVNKNNILLDSFKSVIC